MKLNKHLATSVMKWRENHETNLCHASYYDPLKYDNNYASDEQSYEILVQDWNPKRDIKQAIMCVAARAQTKPENLTMANLARVIDIGKNQNMPLSLALCLDCAKATGWIQDD